MDESTRTEVKNFLNYSRVELVAYCVVSGRDEEDWRNLFEFANVMGIKIINSEPNPADLDMVNRLAGEYGITIALHNHPKPSNYWNPDFVLESVINRKNLKVCADVAHWVRSKFKLILSLIYPISDPDHLLNIRDI